MRKLGRAVALAALQGMLVGLAPILHAAIAEAQSFRPTYEQDMARRGQDYRSFQPPGPSALYCQQACVLEIQCRSWSYAPEGDDKKPTCWLKSGVPAAVAARGLVSGVVRPDGAPPAANAPTAQPNTSAAVNNAPPPTASPALLYKRSAQSGVDSLLIQERSWDANCQPLSLQLTVTRQPASGALRVVEGTSTIPESTLRGGSTGPCAGRPITGNQVIYRSTAGFLGFDTAAYDLTYADGRRQSVDLIINVTTAPAAPALPAAAGVTPPTANAPSTPPNTPVAMNSAPPPRALRESAQSGVDSRLIHERSWDANCQPLPLQLTVTRQPASGALWVVQASSTIPERTVRNGDTGACAGKPMIGNLVMYRSNPGFVGSDTAAYDLTYADGRRQSVNLIIDVRAASAAAPAQPAAGATTSPLAQVAPAAVRAPAQAAAAGPTNSCTVASGREGQCNSHRRETHGRERRVSITVLTAPANGKVVTRIIQETGNNGRQVHATGVFYQSRPGFVGQDSFTYQRRSEDRDDPLNGNVYTMNVTVQ